MCVYHGRNQREKNVCGVANQAVCNRRRSWTEASDHSRGCITCPSLGRRLRSDKCVSSQEYVSVRIVLSSRIGKEEDWIEYIQNRRPLSFSFHFLEDTRARCIRTVGYEYVGGAPSVVVVVVVVVRHRKTLDSAAHEYAKRIASSRAKVIFFSLSLFFLPFFFSLAASTPTAQAIVQEIRATLPASLSRNISRPLFICFPFTCDTLSVTGIAEFHPPVIEENFSLFRRESHLFFLNCPLEERITLPCNFSILLSRAHTMMRAFAYPSFAKNQGKLPPIYRTICG